jgi:hypothetical protein
MYENSAIFSIEIEYYKEKRLCMCTEWKITGDSERSYDLNRNTSLFRLHKAELS